MRINHVKSRAMTLAFSLDTDINQIFQMRYCRTFNDNLEQSYGPSKFAVKKIVDLLGSRLFLRVYIVIAALRLAFLKPLKLGCSKVSLLRFRS